MEAEKEAIRREYEGRLAEMRSQYMEEQSGRARLQQDLMEEQSGRARLQQDLMEEQSGRARLQQDLMKVQQEYEDKLAQVALKGEVAQGAGPAAAGSSPPSGVPPTAQVALIRVCCMVRSSGGLPV